MGVPPAEERERSWLEGRLVVDVGFDAVQVLDGLVDALFGLTKTAVVEMLLANRMSFN